MIFKIFVWGIGVVLIFIVIFFFILFCVCLFEVFICLVLYLISEVIRKLNIINVIKIFFLIDINFFIIKFFFYMIVFYLFFDNCWIIKFFINWVSCIIVIKIVIV